MSAPTEATPTGDAALTDALARVGADVPSLPSDAEMTAYLRPRRGVLVPASLVSFALGTVSAAHLLAGTAALAWLWPYLAFGVAYFAISLAVNLHRGGFRWAEHDATCARHGDEAGRAGVDVWLPTCGEPLDVLANTWTHVRRMLRAHEARGGSVAAYVLDDAARPEVAALAARFGFAYSARADRPWMKKAGNLRHGYRLSGARTAGAFVVIFDADFAPRADFLAHTLPYFAADPGLGLLQTPQYFDADGWRPWLERGAAVVQEFFYRYSQQAREAHDAAICVGTNAVYRRAALDDCGGTALVEHSEDVHTGFALRRAGWGLRYVPLVLAKGLCPDSPRAFFAQQYRWAMGSLSLLTSRAFWAAPLRARQRLCYLTGFGYYAHTAATALLAPVVPLYLLTAGAAHVALANYALILPGFAYAYVVFPLWHRSPYGAEAWAVRMAYSWAHLVAVADRLRGRAMGWRPTGATSVADARAGAGGSMGDGAGRHRRADGRYRAFRAGQLALNVAPGLAWVGLAAWRVVAGRDVAFVPLLCSGAFYAATALRLARLRDPAPTGDGPLPAVTALVPAMGPADEGKGA